MDVKDKVGKRRRSPEQKCRRKCRRNSNDQPASPPCPYYLTTHAYRCALSSSFTIYNLDHTISDRARDSDTKVSALRPKPPSARPYVRGPGRWGA